MDAITKELYGEFPRDGAVPHRFSLFSESHFDDFVSLNRGQNNIYSSISWYRKDGIVCDKISFDIDCPYKVNGDVVHPMLRGKISESKLFEYMMNDRELANSILGESLKDARAVLRLADEERIPTITVFTGLGFHIHLLFKPRYNPTNHLRSTGEKYRKELSLDTMDERVIGDIRRILRVPNVPRVSEGGESLPVWCVPLTTEEVMEKDVCSILDIARGPRQIDPPSLSRPKMKIYEDYLKIGNEQSVPYKEFRHNEDISDEEVEWLVRKIIPMPCVSERILGVNPEHFVRFQFAVFLSKLGFSVDSAHSIIRKLNWRDYDPEVTGYQLRHIYRKNYDESPCSTMERKGYCVHPSEPETCPVYGWSKEYDDE